MKSSEPNSEDGRQACLQNLMYMKRFTFLQLKLAENGIPTFSKSFSMSSDQI